MDSVYNEKTANFSQIHPQSPQNFRLWWADNPAFINNRSQISKFEN